MAGTDDDVEAGAVLAESDVDDVLTLSDVVVITAVDALERSEAA